MGDTRMHAYVVHKNQFTGALGLVSVRIASQREGEVYLDGPGWVFGGRTMIPTDALDTTPTAAIARFVRRRQGQIADCRAEITACERAIAEAQRLDTAVPEGA